MNFFILFKLLLSLFLVKGQDLVPYSGYSVLRTRPLRTIEEIRSLQVLDGHEGIAFWTYPGLHATTDILVSPLKKGELQNTLTVSGIGYNEWIADIGMLVGEERSATPPPLEDEQTRCAQERVHTDASTFFKQYHRHHALMSWIHALNKSEGVVGVEVIGKSWEGRDLELVTISSGGGGRKKAIWIDAGLSSREWIAPATALYLIHKLAKEDELLKEYDFHILPLVNVDGYEWTHVGDRMWSKTRSRYFSGCVGVNPDRNFGFQWGKEGSSSDPCSSLYAGPRPFSEPEVAHMARAIQQRPNILLHISLHSYGQKWLMPLAYTNSTKIQNYSELIKAGRVGVEALEGTHGTPFLLGRWGERMYVSSGTGLDWVKESAGVKYAYSIHLRDTGRYGYLLPSHLIIPTGEETLNGIKALAKHLLIQKHPL